MRRIFSVVYGVLMVLAVILVVVIAILARRPIKDAQKALIIGETYQVDGPYPATLKVSGVSNQPWFGVVKGDLYVVLPEGSKEVEITRFFDRPDTIAYGCAFYIQFTLPDGIRQTWTWQNCASLNGLSVIPDEIYAK